MVQREWGAVAELLVGEVAAAGVGEVEQGNAI
jgi:hypothetical protein